ncbi:probable carboxylesterase 9 [Punica granatum]|uniref:Alpha/beta hydrolase fold-3 domain-containing protein n=2 Tax=Punica granatum TaxID=22663 RepID=A0A218VXC4_PUNGR|nr:probable carboxylesterase 9 [Punica granatum]OWM64973.1 hypothetical protein CDL15_Pgr028691 [Punica granatum]PKI49560.1 hypothetical protein CRG98_030053 [Punica granatum]
MSKFDPYEFLKVACNPDGTFTRNMVERQSDAEPDESSGVTVVSKDVTFNKEKNAWVRLYRPTKIPSNDGTAVRLPIVIYFHGGFWIHVTARDTVCHEFCKSVSTMLTAIVVSVNYRLAPENRLPAQYEDAVDAIHWVRDQGMPHNLNPEPWLHNYGDFSRSYLYGMGTGGNVAFFAALRIGETNLEPMKIDGLILSQPMFGGLQRTKSEIRFATDPLLPLPALDLMWELTLPKWVDRDHRYCNPLIDGTHKDKLRQLPRCLVVGFGMDPLIDRQQDFVTMLVMAGVRVEARFDEIGFHGIDYVDTRRTDAVIGVVKEFMH